VRETLKARRRFIARAAIFSTPVKCPGVRERVMDIEEESGESDKFAMSPTFAQNKNTMQPNHY
jgi:hypothetical protein